MMKKSRIFAVLAAMAIELVFFGCKAEIETEYVDKTYAEAVTFTAEDAGEAGVKVAMASKTEGAAIYYTADGTEPTENSEKYTEAVTFGKDTVVKAFAVKEGIENSPVSVANVSIKTKTITEKVYVCAKCQKEYATAQEAIDCEKTDTTETTLPDEYSVGNTVVFENANYYVVSNTIGSSAKKESISRAAASTNGNKDDVTALVQTLSVERATAYATKYFGNIILLLRTSGKVTVPNGETSLYQETYNTIKAGLSENEKISDYFIEKWEETKNDVDYTDIYVILDSSKEKIGTCNVNWNSDLNKTFDDDKTLFDLIKDFSPNLIRKIIPAQYTIRKYDTILKCSYDVMDNKLEEDGRYRLLENAKNSLYVANNRIIRAATLANEWDADGNWMRSYISPSACYGKLTATAGFTYTVRYENGKFNYRIQGSSKITDSTRYDSGKINFEFDENNRFVADNIVIPADSGLYSADADLKYDENTLSVPIEFIRNDDGSVSFGPSVDKWVENWRDYIISSHAGDYVYEE